MIYFQNAFLCFFLIFWINPETTTQNKSLKTISTSITFVEEGSMVTFDIIKPESVQISIGPGISESEYDKPYGVAMEKIYLK